MVAGVNDEAKSTGIKQIRRTARGYRNAHNYRSVVIMTSVSDVGMTLIREAGANDHEEPCNPYHGPSAPRKNQEAPARVKKCDLTEAQPLTGAGIDLQNAAPG